VSLTHCIICVLYESVFVNNKSRNNGLKLMRLSFHFFIHSFIDSLHLGLQRELLTIPAAGRLSTMIKSSDICYNLLVIFRPAFVCLSVCPQDNSKTNALILIKVCMLPTLQKLIYECNSQKNVCDHYKIIL